MGRSAGTGQPLAFMCWRERRDKWRYTVDGFYKSSRAPRHTVRRTGRTRGDTDAPRYYRKLGYRVQYRCSCGHVGWTTHPDILRYP